MAIPYRERQPRVQTSGRRWLRLPKFQCTSTRVARRMRRFYARENLKGVFTRELFSECSPQNPHRPPSAPAAVEGTSWKQR